MATLKAKLFAAASASTALQALLGTSPFRWYDTQLPQAASFPAVVANQISAPRDYVLGGRMSTYRARMQLTVYGTGNDSENASAVVAAITGFIQTFNAIGVPNLPVYPNRVLGDKDGGIAQTQPLTYQRFLDVEIWNDENE